MLLTPPSKLLQNIFATFLLYIGWGLALNSSPSDSCALLKPCQFCFNKYRFRIFKCYYNSIIECIIYFISILCYLFALKKQNVIIISSKWSNKKILLLILPSNYSNVISVYRSFCIRFLSYFFILVRGVAIWKTNAKHNHSIRSIRKQFHIFFNLCFTHDTLLHNRKCSCDTSRLHT